MKVFIIAIISATAAVGLFSLGYKLGEKSNDELTAIYKNFADKCLALVERWEKTACDMHEEWGVSIDLNEEMIEYIRKLEKEKEENERRIEAFQSALENRKEELKGTNGDLGGAASGILRLFELIYEKGDFTLI